MDYQSGRPYGNRQMGIEVFPTQKTYTHCHLINPPDKKRNCVRFNWFGPAFIPLKFIHRWIDYFCTAVCRQFTSVCCTKTQHLQNNQWSLESINSISTCTMYFHISTRGEYYLLVPMHRYTCFSSYPKQKWQNGLLFLRTLDVYVINSLISAGKPVSYFRASI